VEEQMKLPPVRVAALLDAVLLAEHAYLEVERLAILAEEPKAEETGLLCRERIEDSMAAIAIAFATHVDRTLGGLNEVATTSPWAVTLSLTVHHLKELGKQTAGSIQTPFSKRATLLGFLHGLEMLATLLEPHERPVNHAAPAPTEALSKRGPLVDSAKIRFSVKFGATITLGLLVGLTTQRADLQTILWSIAVTGQPNQYGAVIRKGILRLAGCVLGGLATLAAMIVVSQNFDSLLPYLIAIFVVSMFSTYVAQSSDWLGYAGIQTGITFLICYVGLAPSSDVYRPLWRFWGIVLGILTTGFVYLFLWPEYASDKLVDALQSLLRATAEFGKAVATGAIDETGISATEQRLSKNLLEVLNLADQARLEGRPGATRSAAAIESASTLIRVAYRFALIARGQIGASASLLPELEERRRACQSAYCKALEMYLARLDAIGSGVRQTEPLVVKVEELAPMTDELVAALLRNSGEVTTLLVAQAESYNRLQRLFLSLDESLWRMATSPQA
jgi:hypothetical protein